MMPDTLDDNSLSVFVFGPGFGECIAIRVPPGLWIIVDSCHIAGRAAALHVLEKYGGETACAILTHPHRDHYRGFSGVLDFDDWRRVGCCDLRLEDGEVDLSRDPGTRSRNELEDALARISDHWRRDPSSRWWTWRGTSHEVGDARVISLHPTREYARANPGAKPNHLSCALLVEWKGARLVLGADVENPHWDEICAALVTLNEHTAMKVPHHGSRGSLCDDLLRGAPTRVWMITPYSLGEKLPRFDDGDAVDVMLRHVAEIHLTGLPIAHSGQHESPCVSTRQKLSRGEVPRPTPFNLPGDLSGAAMSARDELSCYLFARFDATGRGGVTIHGPGTVRVTEEAMEAPA